MKPGVKHRLKLITYNYYFEDYNSTTLMMIKSEKLLRERKCRDK